MKWGLLLAAVSPWVPLREGNENKQAADFISFYRVVSLYGKQSKCNKPMASTAAPTQGPVPISPLVFPRVLIMLLSCLCRRKLPFRSLPIISPSSYFILGVDQLSRSCREI